MKNYKIAYGSIIGKEHRNTGKNNQDALNLYIDDNLIIGIICDGCSDGLNNEFGAKFGAKVIIRILVKLLHQYCNINNFEEILEITRQKLIKKIKFLSKLLGNSTSQIINDYFLFTIIGFIITQKQTILLNIGDGCVIINNEIIQIGPFPNNMPPYLGYTITGSSLRFSNPDVLKFQIIRSLTTESIDHILIGSDGIVDLINCEFKNIPGKNETVGNINQFWLNNKFFTNPDMIRRKLFMINNESIKLDSPKQQIIKEHGLLPDDTTMIVVKKS